MKQWTSGSARGTVDCLDCGAGEMSNVAEWNPPDGSDNGFWDIPDEAKCPECGSSNLNLCGLIHHEREVFGDA